MTRTPKVSILMTACNRGNYIAAAIESVLVSSYNDFEFIITDDCSTDDTVSIVESYIQKDPRIKLYKNENNLGDYPNRNKAASYAVGQYIKYLDADDLLYPHGLDVMVTAMEKFPEAAFGLSFAKADDVEPYPRMLAPSSIIRSEFLHDSYLGVGPSASIIRRQAFEKLGGFNGRQFTGDTELWLRLGAIYPMVVFQPSLNWWRQHPEQQMHLERKNLDIQIERLHLGLKHLALNRHFFTEAEYWFAVKRKKQHFARGVLAQYRNNGDLKRLFYMINNSGISARELLSGFRSYY